MTIDEAIAHEREVAEEQRKDNDNCKYKSQYGCKDCADYYSKPCIECAKEHEQLAEWLEELKDYRDKNKMVVRVDVENMDNIKDKIEELSKYAERQYDKAIDDFVENISLEISESIIWGMLVNSHKDNSFNDTSDKIVDYVINTANEIAEQLKAGGENERSIWEDFGEFGRWRNIL